MQKYLSAYQKIQLTYLIANATQYFSPRHDLPETNCIIFTDKI